MKKINIGILLILLALSACEITVDNQELPYKEQLVVRAILENGKAIDGIEISKTLPPLEQFDPEKALISDANVIVRFQDKDYLFEYNSAKRKYYNNELIPEITGEYFLTVLWENHKATAHTRIPEPIEIEYFTYDSEFYKNSWDNYWEFRLIANFNPKAKSAYVGNAEYGSYWEYYSDYIYRSKDTLKNGRISLPVYEYTTWSERDSSYIENEFEKYICHIDCYDEDFYDYFLTRYKGQSGDDIFGTSGLNINGNIYGGIGLFIGLSKTSKKVVF